jgi:hypothetical protein
MPFHCGKRSAGICVVLGPKNPQRIPANTPPVFSSLRPRICTHLLRLATKDYSDRLLEIRIPCLASSANSRRRPIDGPDHGFLQLGNSKDQHSYKQHLEPFSEVKCVEPKTVCNGPV